MGRDWYWVPHMLIFADLMGGHGQASAEATWLSLPCVLEVWLMSSICLGQAQSHLEKLLEVASPAVVCQDEHVCVVLVHPVQLQGLWAVLHCQLDPHLLQRILSALARQALDLTAVHG